MVRNVLRMSSQPVAYSDTFWKCTSLQIIMELEGGPMPNVMAAQPNIGGALCESSVIPFLVPRRKFWLTPAAGVPCNNAANIGESKTWT